MSMKCHYEVLGVERAADTDVIKKAYKEMARKVSWLIFLNTISEMRIRFWPKTRIRGSVPQTKGDF